LEYHDPIFTIELWKALQNIEGIAPQLLDCPKHEACRKQNGAAQIIPDDATVDVEGLKDFFFRAYQFTA